MSFQTDLQGNLERFYKDARRVLKVAKKPDREEYVMFTKITVLGIAVIGVIGFVIVLIGTLINL